MGQVHAVLYEGVVLALRLHALLDGCYDAHQAPIQRGEVRLGQNGGDGVEGERLAHGAAQGPAPQQVQPVPRRHAHPEGRGGGEREGQSERENRERERT